VSQRSKNTGFIANSGILINEAVLFFRVSEIIENRKSRVALYANSEITLMFWEIGQYISSVLLGGERAEYGKRIVAELASQLVKNTGIRLILTIYAA
jgi:hypothetical protein